MSIIYSLDPTKSTVFAIWEGAITAEAWYQSFAEFLTETDLSKVRRVLVDVQQVTNDADITEAHTENITQIFAENAEGGRSINIAVVARGELLNSVSSAEQALLRRHFSVVTFNFLDTACIYLGIPLEETRRTLNELRARMRSAGNE